MNDSTIENGVCLLCDTTTFRRGPVLGQYHVGICTQCGLGHTQPFPTPNQLANVNASTYALAQRIHTYAARRGEFEKRYRCQLAEIDHWLGPRQEKTLLDVGCNLGVFLSVARECGYNVQGVELNGECAEYARTHNNLDVFCGTLESASFPAESFDVITLWDVLEHVPNPRALLDEINRLLKRNGLVVIQSPNMISKMAQITDIHWNWWTMPDHLYHFTPDTMQSLVSEQGFSIVDMHTWEPAIDFANNVMVSHLPSRKIGPKNIVGRGMRRMTYETSRLIAPIVTRMQRRTWESNNGGLIVVSARKRD